ncbi:hypothetical protein pdam_00012354 [Pocillopora damicornis]|uniref:Uncharacterized protein n=1 Tax=Pocillopora damicornis TaxID=46731 RepID=A0A3M6U260_POCDA|nr:hypothetical protein pdam_00012354 [Pocillopora damicornis]
MSTYTSLTTTTAIHRSKASVLVRKLAQFKCFEHAVERKLLGYKGNIPFHLHGCCYCYQDNKQDTIFRRSRVDTLLLIRLWQQSNSIHRSKASVLVQKLAQFKCFEHVVERKLSGYKGNIIPFHLHGCCSCYPATRYYTSRSYTGRN